jgi:hypothetical protein
MATRIEQMVKKNKSKGILGELKYYAREAGGRIQWPRPPCSMKAAQAAEVKMGEMPEVNR